MESSACRLWRSRPDGVEFSCARSAISVGLKGCTATCCDDPPQPPYPLRQPITDSFFPTNPRRLEGFNSTNPIELD